MIMKKTYISPNTKTVALRSHHMLCALSGGEAGLGYGGTTSGKVNEAGSRGGSFWDDDDEY